MFFFSKEKNYCTQVGRTAQSVGINKLDSLRIKNFEQQSSITRRWRSSVQENHHKQLRLKLEECDVDDPESRRYDSPERVVVTESDHNTDSEQSIDYDDSDDDPIYGRQIAAFELAWKLSAKN